MISFFQEELRVEELRNRLHISLEGCVPMFPSPYLPHSFCSPVPMFPVPMFPDPIFPSSYIPQSLSSPTRYALCFPASVFPSPFASHPYVLQPFYSPVSIVTINGFPSLCSPNIFPSPYVPQSLCSAGPLSKVPMLPSPYRLDVPQSLCSPNKFPSPDVPQSPCSSTNQFTSPYVPQSPCSSTNQFTSPYVPQSLSFVMQ